MDKLFYCDHILINNSPWDRNFVFLLKKQDSHLPSESQDKYANQC